MDQIRTELEQWATLTDDDWQFFASKLEKQQFAKCTIMVEVGQVENHLSFIEQGIVRFYIPQQEANDITFGFSFPGEFVSAYDSFLTRSASVYRMETLTAATLWRISYADLQLIYNHTASGNAIGRMAAERLFLIKSAREIALLRDTPEQRYLKLFQNRPYLLKHIPLKYIASYIGITPQALSRIRRRIS